MCKLYMLPLTGVYLDKSNGKNVCMGQDTMTGAACVHAPVLVTIAMTQLVHTS